VTNGGRSSRGILRGSDKLDFLEFEAKIIHGFMNQVRVFFADVAKLHSGDADEENAFFSVAVFGWLEPSVV